MPILDKKTSIDLGKLMVFIVVTTLATGLLIVLIGNLSFKGGTTYRAVFTDATGVNKGDDVRVAGVKVGTVRGIDIDKEDRALVTFLVEDGVGVTKSTFASIRYRNLVGQRYISLSQAVGSSEMLKENDTIPVGQTKPALDLTVLFNGFKPLFEALTTDDLNKLSYEVVQVFQGEGGTLESLLGHTASLTQTLAERDQVIGALIDNLNFVLDHVADRDVQLTNLIRSFKNLVTGLAQDREAILSSLDGISDLSVETAALVKGIRPPFVEDVKQLRAFAGNVDRNKKELDRTLQVLPIKLEKVGRTAIYGAWFNFFICDLKGNLVLPAGLGSVPINAPTNAERCDLG